MGHYQNPRLDRSRVPSRVMTQPEVNSSMRTSRNRPVILSCHRWFPMGIFNSEHIWSAGAESQILTSKDSSSVPSPSINSAPVGQRGLNQIA